MRFTLGFAHRSAPDRRTVAPFVFVCALWGGCAEPGRTTDASFIRRDSAGVVIIENLSPAWEANEAWRIGEAPRLVIGAVDGPPELLFDRIRGVLRLSDGTIVVADGRTSEIRFFDSLGVFSGRIGRPGSGPGEFRHLTSITALPGDSILAFDQVLWRATVFSPTRTLVREVRLTPVAASLELVLPRADGKLLLANRASLIPEARPDGLHRYPRRYFLYSADGATVDTIASLPGLEFEIRFDSRESNWGAMEVPFARNAVDAARDDRWLTADNARFEIQARDRTGQVVRIIRYAAAELAIDDTAVRALERRVIAGLARPADGPSPALRRLFHEVPRPSIAPALSRLHLLPDGHFIVGSWVSTFEPPNIAPSVWWVFSPKGVLQGRLQAPAAFTLFQAGDHHLVGTLTDELGVQRIAVYTLDRRP